MTRKRQYTPSGDGVRRATLRLTVRLSEEELTSCERAAKRSGLSLHDWLGVALSNGIAEMDEQDAEADED
jgi:hypothetical protein